MFFRDADSSQRVALYLGVGLMVLILASVLVLGAYQRSAFAGNASASALVAKSPSLARSSSAQADSDAASIKIEQGVVKFYFASGKAELADGASEALADLVKGAKTGRKLVISGFHDATGQPAQNSGLARQRALTVRRALMKAGVAQNQIELKTSEQATGIGSNAEARRVEISLQ